MCKTVDESEARPDVGCTELLAAAVIEKARRVRQMFDAKAPNELLWAHDELADALDEYDTANAPLRLQGGATAEPCNGESGCSALNGGGK